MALEKKKKKLHLSIPLIFIHEKLGLGEDEGSAELIITV